MGTGCGQPSSRAGHCGDELSRVIWAPQAGSQTHFLSCPIFECLYEGTRGPGKTDALLMDFAQHVGKGYGAAWRGILFRREYKELADVVAKSKKWFYRIFPGIKFLESASEYKWRWPSGEELLFRTAKKPDDYWNYHGHEYPWIGWEELTNWADSKLYEDMMSVCRSSVPGMPRKYRSTCNPYGIGHNWVKARFIAPAPRGVVIQDDKGRARVALHGSIFENKILLQNDPEYLKNLQAITDENKRKAWLEGCWDIVAGGALDDVWSPRVVIPRFRLPSAWQLDRSFDWGSTHPFAVCWWGQADGTEATLPNGAAWCPPAGSLILAHEWYGATKEPNEGLKMAPKAIAEGIIRIEGELFENDWIVKRPEPGPADNQISNVTQPDTPTIEAEMLDAGVAWTKSDKSPGTRKIGLDLIRARLAEAGKDHPEDPALYIMSHCRTAQAQLPVLPRDQKNPDDVDSDAEDHLYDAVRYRVLAAKRGTWAFGSI